ncbi:hypothetical protein AOLI_G00166850 [Acnodon oligacanthus]
MASKWFINSLHSEDGQELTEPVDIRKRAVRFYSELNRSEYKENGELASSFCASVPKVSEQPNAELEWPLDVQELHAALQSMEGGTAPGIDGLPVEFDKAFWAELGADWLAVLNGRADTMWRGKLGLGIDKRPVWRVLYKPPLTKRSGDLQWRILHGAVAVNSFVSVISPHNRSSTFPFTPVFFRVWILFSLTPLSHVRN